MSVVRDFSRRFYRLLCVLKVMQSWRSSDAGRFFTNRDHGGTELPVYPRGGAIVVNVARHALRQYSASFHGVLSEFGTEEGESSCPVRSCTAAEYDKKCLSPFNRRNNEAKDGGRQPRERHQQRGRARDRADHQGIDDRRPPKGRLPILPGVLHGPVPAGRAEDDLAEGDDGGHAEAAARFPHQLPGDAAADPDRQRGRDTGEREDRAAHHEEHSRRAQSVRAGQRSGHSRRKLVQQAEAAAAERQGQGQGSKVLVPDGASAEDRRASGPQGDALPHRRHDVLLRLRADASTPAHQGRRQVFRRLRDPGHSGASLAVYASHVQAGRFPAELPRRPGHHQPLQAATEHEDEEARGAGDSNLHDQYPDRGERRLGWTSAVGSAAI